MCLNRTCTRDHERSGRTRGTGRRAYCRDQQQLCLNTSSLRLMGSRGIGRCSHLANTRTCGGVGVRDLPVPAPAQLLDGLAARTPPEAARALRKCARHFLWRDLPAELLEKSCARAFIPRASVLSSSSEARRPPRHPDFVAASLDVTVRLGPGLFFETQ